MTRTNAILDAVEAGNGKTGRLFEREAEKRKLREHDSKEEDRSHSETRNTELRVLTFPD